jgi:hypothetical protein
VTRMERWQSTLQLCLPMVPAYLLRLWQLP